MAPDTAAAQMPTSELIRRLNAVACERLDFIKACGLEDDFTNWRAWREVPSGA